ncbi:MAG: TolB family protein, partial [Vicinamibacterales bacterium]
MALATVAAVLTLTSTAATQPPVTLEALLSAPFSSEMVAAPAGGRVAWVQNAKGSRNVWTASAPDFSARQLTLHAGDDGQDITSLTWAQDGRTVLYVRGGGPNRQGEIPNPALSIEGTEQAIWAVEVSGTTVSRKLATGSSPAVSPTGEVVYLA